MKNEHRLPLSVGYPCYAPISFYDMVAPYLGRIGEVYFGWKGFATGRATFEGDPRDTHERMVCDLLRFQKKGIRLNLLLNGNCYGGEAISRRLEQQVVNTIDEVRESLQLDAVTAVSPFIAHVVKKHFPQTEVRASVNTWIDGVFGMEQCADVFDSFYVKRDYHYCMEEIGKQRQWCDANGEKLYLLANSGCIPHCAYHSFHDNMVAHSKELEKQDKAPEFAPFVCRKLLSRDENRYLLLAGNLVRPEDVFHYEGLVDGIKLATRIHPYPAILVGAYARGRWVGDLCDLTEPGFGDLLGGCRLENGALPADYWQKRTTCPRAQSHGASDFCKACGYCEGLVDSIRVSAEE